MESGYGGLSIDGVAGRAGVHKTTVYRQWPNREGLVTDAILQLSDRELPVPDTGRLRSDLVALAMAIAAQITQPRVTALTRTLVAEGPRLPAFQETARSFWSRRFTLTGRVIQRAILRGELTPETDVPLLLESLIGPLYLRLLVTGEELSEEFIIRVVDLTSTGYPVARKHPSSIDLGDVEREPIENAVEDCDEDRDRNERDDQRSGGGRPFELALEREEVAHGKWDGLYLPGGQYQGHEQQVPVEDEHDDRRRRDAGCGQRHDDLTDHAEEPGSIQPRGLLPLAGQLAHRTVEDVDGEGSGDRRLRQNDAHERIDQLSSTHEVAQRDHVGHCG